MRYKPLPPLEELRENIDYNPNTGILIWKKTPFRNLEGKTVGRDNGVGYLQTRYKKKFYLCSRLAYYIYHGVDPLQKQVDHINRDRLDNRIKNLRLATPSQNIINASLNKNNTSGFKGVHWNKREKRWLARIKVNGESKHLGSFINKEDAIQARSEGEIKYFGEFARKECNERIRLQEEAE